MEIRDKVQINKTTENLCRDLRLIKSLTQIDALLNFLLPTRNYRADFSASPLVFFLIQLMDH